MAANSRHHGVAVEFANPRDVVDEIVYLADVTELCGPRNSRFSAKWCYVQERGLMGFIPTREHLQHMGQECVNSIMRPSMDDLYGNYVNSTVPMLEWGVVYEGMAIAAWYQSKWYRAIVLKRNADRSVEVYYIDYGNCRKISLGNLRPLHRSLVDWPVQLVCGYLAEGQNILEGIVQPLGNIFADRVYYYMLNNSPNLLFDIEVSEGGPKNMYYDLIPHWPIRIFKQGTNVEFTHIIVQMMRDYADEMRPVASVSSVGRGRRMQQKQSTSALHPTAGASVPCTSGPSLATTSATCPVPMSYKSAPLPASRPSTSSASNNIAGPSTSQAQSSSNTLRSQPLVGMLVNVSVEDPSFSQPKLAHRPWVRLQAPGSHLPDPIIPTQSTLAQSMPASRLHPSPAVERPPSPVNRVQPQAIVSTIASKHVGGARPKVKPVNAGPSSDQIPTTSNGTSKQESVIRQWGMVVEVWDEKVGDGPPRRIGRVRPLSQSVCNQAFLFDNATNIGIKIPNPPGDEAVQCLKIKINLVKPGQLYMMEYVESEEAVVKLRIIYQDEEDPHSVMVGSRNINTKLAMIEHVFANYLVAQLPCDTRPKPLYIPLDAVWKQPYPVSWCKPPLPDWIYVGAPVAVVITPCPEGLVVPRVANGPFLSTITLTVFKAEGSMVQTSMHMKVLTHHKDGTGIFLHSRAPTNDVDLGAGPSFNNATEGQNRPPRSHERDQHNFRVTAWLPRFVAVQCLHLKKDCDLKNEVPEETQVDVSLARRIPTALNRVPFLGYAVQQRRIASPTQTLNLTPAQPFVVWSKDSAFTPVSSTKKGSTSN